jgi:hypothetical protein
MRVVLAFEVKRLPSYVDQAFSAPASNGVAPDHKPEPTPART